MDVVAAIAASRPMTLWKPEAQSRQVRWLLIRLVEQPFVYLRHSRILLTWNQRVVRTADPPRGGPASVAVRRPPAEGEYTRYREMG